jgi:hypothetical protein
MPAIHTVHNTPKDPFLGVRGLATHWQVRHPLYLSERLNPRATDILCCPGQLRGSFATVFLSSYF